ncbi:myosin tail domain-containing protein [Ditylenchus destructor]|uniref:Myosin tail domain-containing protein n=1 Tax=Ditylenchus destructor TaxID=166010 RepID=A0AAD4MIG3_9BILA|nr:myosin tail domain-containing protein [Ditylenchus destructor]
MVSLQEQQEEQALQKQQLEREIANMKHQLIEAKNKVKEDAEQQLEELRKKNVKDLEAIQMQQNAERARFANAKRKLEQENQDLAKELEDARIASRILFIIIITTFFIVVIAVLGYIHQLQQDRDLMIKQQQHQAKLEETSRAYAQRIRYSEYDLVPVAAGQADIDGRYAKWAVWRFDDGRSELVAEPRTIAPRRPNDRKFGGCDIAGFFPDAATGGNVQQGGGNNGGHHAHGNNQNPVTSMDY